MSTTAPLAGQDIADADYILIDAQNTLWRAAYAGSGLGNRGPDGTWTPTGALYGFLESVLAVAHRAPHAEVVIVWEGSREGRTAIDPGYKAHRDEPDDAKKELIKIMAKQAGFLREVLRRSAWTQAKAAGWEADDAMATLAAAAFKAGLKTVIYTNDGDLLQCLRESDPEDIDASTAWVRQFITTKTKGDGPKGFVWTAPRLLAERGLAPWQVPHMKALAGDASDGYKGVPGIGETTATQWLRGRKSCADVIADARIGLIKGAKATALLDNLDAVRTCLDLATVRDNLAVRLQDGEADEPRLASLLKGLRFHSLCNARTLGRMTT